MTAEWRARLANSVKGAGIGVRNPVDAAPHSFETSKLATSYLVSHLIEGGRFSTNHHSAVVSECRQKHKQRRKARELEQLHECEGGNAALKLQYQRASSSGHWLQTIPNRLNGNRLSAEEFRDNLRLQENLKPLDMPSKCDGCGAPLTVDHAMTCKCGGLVHI